MPELSYKNISCPVLTSESAAETALKQLFLQRALDLDQKLRLGKVRHWQLSKSPISAQQIHAESSLHTPINNLARLHFMCDRSAIFESFSEETTTEAFIRLTKSTAMAVHTIELMSNGAFVWSEYTNKRSEFRQPISGRVRLQHTISEIIEVLA